jgi:hypothetical protein
VAAARCSCSTCRHPPPTCGRAYASTCRTSYGWARSTRSWLASPRRLARSSHPASRRATSTPPISTVDPCACAPHGNLETILCKLLLQGAPHAGLLYQQSNAPHSPPAPCMRACTRARTGELLTPCVPFAHRPLTLCRFHAFDHTIHINYICASIAAALASVSNAGPTGGPISLRHAPSVSAAPGPVHVPRCRPPRARHTRPWGSSASAALWDARCARGAPHSSSTPRVSWSDSRTRPL